MRRYFLLFLLAFGSALTTGCTNNGSDSEQKGFYVTIEPLRSIISKITDEDFRIDVLVPSGASPETFEPTPRQIARIHSAELVFGVGLLDFEQTLLPKTADSSRWVNLSEGIELIGGSCSHMGDEHHHGIDPHVWLSPRELQIIAANAYEAIHRLYPDSTRYTKNFEVLARTLKELDIDVAKCLAESGSRSILIYHPALTYYARAYGLEQIAIEDEGKEPSARRLAQLIERARKDEIHSVFYQTQFPASAVETICRDIEAKAIGFDPLQEDVIANIRQITSHLTESNR